MQEERVCRWELLWVVARSFVVAVLLHGCNHARTNLAQYSESGSQKVIALREITSDQGRAFLDELGLGTVSLLPDRNGVLVTAAPDELQKARVVLDLVDKKEEFVIEAIAPAAAFGLIEAKDEESVPEEPSPFAAVRTLPDNEQIARALGGITIGTFVNPPQLDRHAQAIIDVHGESVVAIIPENRLEELLQVVGHGVKTIEQEKKALPPPDQIDRRPDQMPAVGPPIEVVKNPPDVQPEDANESLKKSIPARSHLRITESDRLIASSNAQLKARTDSAATLEAPTPDDSRQEGSSVSITRPPAVPGDESSSKTQEITAKSSEKATKTTADEQAYQIRPPANGDDILELDLPEKLELIRLLDLVGKYLHLDYMYDPDKIKNQMVTLKLNGKLQGEIRVKDLYSLLESVLNFKGFVMTRHEGNLVTIAPVADVMQVDPELVDSSSKIIDVGDMVVTRMFELEYIDTFSAVNLLENMRLTVAVSPVPETQTLIVTCYAYRMARIERLLAMVDRPGRLRKVRFRQLEYITADMLAKKIGTLAAELETVGVTIALASPTSPQSGQPLPQPPFPTPNANRSTGGMASGKQTVYLDADERTNRIVMVGYERQLETAEELVDAFDVPQQALRVYRVYELLQVEAQEARKKLQELGVTGEAESKQRTPSVPSPPKPSAPFATQAVSAPGGPLIEEPRVVVLEATNALLVGATLEQHAQLEELVGYVDKIQQDIRVLKVYDIEHTEAKEAREKLAELQICGAAEATPAFKPASLTGTPPAANASSLPSSPASETAGGFQHTLFGKAQVVVVESTNSLLVITTAEQHAQIETVLTYVDSPTREEEIPYKVYPLENSPPSHLAEVLGKLIEDTVQDKEGKIEKVIKREEEITIVPDPNTYSLIVYATKKNQEWIASLVKQLDKRRPQVLIDATLVEVTKADAFSYDLSLLRSSTNLDSTSGITGVGVDPTAIGKFVEWGGGALSAFYGDDEIQVLLSAMRSKSYGRVLAKPKLLVNDNEAGTIKTTDTTYVETKSGIPVNSGAVGDQQNFVETSVNYEPYEAGITLDITPHISEGDLLHLDITLTRSDFLKTDPDKPPDTRSNEVDTAVTLPDGSTIILGGLLKMNQVKGGSKIPILGDIPLIGGLFRSIDNEDTQSKLYVFVKAEIIRPAETEAQGMKDLERLSERDRLEFEKHEDEFQRYQNWPGIKPRPVDPPKVLDVR
ncbi:MAG: secretin N-terminal domain-containing protein [Planctomycetota bacterium]|jgi:type II secretory pathway component GspD/PulD (secretin)